MALINLTDCLGQQNPKNVAFLGSIIDQIVSDRLEDNGFRLAVILHLPASNCEVLENYCFQSAHFTLIPFDMALTPFEVAGVIVETVMRMNPNDQSVQVLRSLRQEESELRHAIHENKIKWLDLLCNLSQPNVIRRPSTDPTLDESMRDRTESIQSSMHNSILTRFHMQIVQLNSTVTATQRRITACQKRRRRLEKQVTSGAAQMGAKGAVLCALRQIALTVSVIDDPLAQLVRFPVQRLSFVAMRQCRDAAEAFRLKPQEGSNSDTVGAEFRIFSQLALNGLIQHLSETQHGWGHPCATMFRLKVAILLDRLRTGSIKQTELLDPNQLIEIKWLHRLLQLVQDERPQHCRWPDFTDTPVCSFLEELEHTVPQLSGLLQSIREHRNLWEETVDGPLTFLRPLPGFSISRMIDVTHVFFVWSLLRPERLYEAAHCLIDHVFAAFSTQGDSSVKLRCEQSFWLGERVKDLLYPIRSNTGLEDYARADLSFGRIFLIPPRSFPSLCIWHFGGEQPVFPESKSSFDSVHCVKEWATKNDRNIISIDLASMLNPADDSFAKKSLSTSDAILLIKNGHLFDCGNVSRTSQSWLHKLADFFGNLQATTKPRTSVNTFGLNPDQAELVSTETFVNERLLLFIDFTGCRSFDQLVDLIRKLPGFIRDTFDFFRWDKIAATSWSPPLSSCTAVRARLAQPCPDYTVEYGGSTIDPYQAAIHVMEPDTLPRSSEKSRKSINTIEELQTGVIEHKHWRQKNETYRFLTLLRSKDSRNWVNCEPHQTDLLLAELKDQITTLQNRCDQLFSTTKPGNLSVTAVTISPRFVFQAEVMELKQQVANEARGGNPHWRHRERISHQLNRCKGLLLAMQKIIETPGPILQIPAELVTNFQTICNWVLLRGKTTSNPSNRLFAKVLKPSDKLHTGHGIMLTKLLLVCCPLPNHGTHHADPEWAYEIEQLWLTSLPENDPLLETSSIEVSWTNIWPPEAGSIRGAIRLIMEAVVDTHHSSQIHYYVVPIWQRYVLS